MLPWMTTGGSFDEQEEDDENKEVSDEITAIDLELAKLKLELAAEKIQIKDKIKEETSEIKTIEDLNNQRKQR